MKQALRVLRILRELPRARGITASTAASLAERFGTSTRSIYRDIALLQEAGYAIAHDRAGYYLLPTDRCVPVDLSAAEIASLVYATYWVDGAVPAALRPDFTGVVEKLTAACGTDEAIISALNGDKGIDISPKQTDGPQAAVNMATAFRARRMRRKLRGIYRSPDRDELTERVLHPYSVSFRGDAHYLVAYCELRGEERTFRLDRFEELEMLDQTAEIPDRYDLEGHFSGAWEVTSGRRQEVKVLIRGKTARRFRSSSLHPTQRMEQRDDGAMELCLRVALTDEFRTWLLGLGPDAVVLEPACLREQIAEIIRKMSANYSPT